MNKEQQLKNELCLKMWNTSYGAENMMESEKRSVDIAYDYIMAAYTPLPREVNLKALSEISDEHAIEVAKIFSLSGKLEIYRDTSYISIENTVGTQVQIWFEEPSFIDFVDADGVYNDAGMSIVHATDYLRQFYTIPNPYAPISSAKPDEVDKLKAEIISASWLDNIDRPDSAVLFVSTANALIDATFALSLSAVADGDRWVSVEDSKPSVDEKRDIVVLGSKRGERVYQEHTMQAHWDGKVWIDHVGHDIENNQDMWYVTHYCILPTPPQQNK